MYYLYQTLVEINKPNEPSWTFAFCISIYLSTSLLIIKIRFSRLSPFLRVVKLQSGQKACSEKSLVQISSYNYLARVQRDFLYSLLFYQYYCKSYQQVKRNDLLLRDSYYRKLFRWVLDLDLRS